MRVPIICAALSTVAMLGCLRSTIEPQTSYRMQPAAAASGEHGARSDEIAQVISLYLLKRELVTHTRPDVAVCDPELQKLFQPGELERIAKAGVGTMLGSATCQSEAPERPGVTLRIGSVRVHGDTVTIKATAETPALLWAEVAEVTGRGGNWYVKRISFSDWLSD
ncbi:MAG: hypothetical protein V4503_07295 [Gemmatimonadota bacterium]